MPDIKKIENCRVLVTGGAGFIGSNICEALLRQNNHVKCLDNFSTGQRENIAGFIENDKFELLEADIRNLDDCKKAVQGVDYILHQAALGSIPRSIKDPITTNGVNITGFLNMLQASKDAGVKRMIYATSSSIYGDHPDLPKIEDEIGKPLSPYAVTKQANELYAKVFSDLYGIETIGLRYFNVFGNKQDTDGAYAAAIPKFIKLMMLGKSPVIYGDGEQTRDFTYIEDVIRCNQLAALTTNKEAMNTVYNVAGGNRTSLNHLFDLLKELLSQYDCNISDIEPLYERERIGDIKNSFASIEKAKKLLGYKPKFNLKKGLEKTILWYWNKLND